MKKKILLAVAAVLATVIVYAAVSLSAGDKGGGGMGGGKGMGPGAGMEMPMGGGSGILARLGDLLDNPEFIEQIGLTDAQVEKLKSLRSNTMKAQIRAEADIKILRLELDDLLDQDKPDLKKIDAKIDEIGKKETEMKKTMIHAMLDGKAVLTDEQLAKLKKMAADRMRDRRNDRRGDGRGPGMEPGPGGMDNPDAGPPPPEGQ